ncbi:peptidoglycan-binding protein [Promicromonospora kroppenstedtii]|uniref:peptidoglycan-binding protein n=1 Tax=Promicromonospora kroppenstedtii TaxID=440482 RepID=UPI0004B34558|nr:peptidoglycan-binding protein [Promicromonospora kroppenstedtii]
MAEVDKLTRDAPSGGERPRRRRHARTVAWIVVGVAAAGGAAAGVHAFASSAQRQVNTAQVFQGDTDEVVLGDLEGSTTAAGTLRFSDPRAIQSARAGVVTGLPKAGTVVSPGERLYGVDNVSVFLLRGGLPAWRDYESGMSDGPDVRQLERNLRALGHLDEQPDATFTWDTTEAIMDWQEENDQTRTGELTLGSVQFADGALRIGTLTASVGDQTAPGAELFEATGTEQVVNVNMRLADQQLAVLGTEVTVRLPGGEETTGHITSVGTPTETEDGNGQPQTVIPVVVALDDPQAASAFQEASVTVDIPSARREDVLSVPIGALIAITPQQFGVEVVDADGGTRQVPVDTGLFAGGRVEISGDDVAAGQRVVVPQR